MNHRRSDDPTQVRVTREIPLWGLLTVLGGLACQAVLIWAGQREQQLAITQLTAQVAQSAEQLGRMSGALGSQNVKNAEHDWALRDLDRRLQALEHSPGGPLIRKP